MFKKKINIIYHDKNTFEENLFLKILFRLQR